jgi:hypothetical protein
MTGTARSLLLLTAILLQAAGLASVACGGPSSDGPRVQAPSSPASPGGANSAGASSGSENGPTATGPATPERGSSWPFAPAPSADDLKAQLDRLAKDPGPIKTNWTPPGKSERYGHAEGIIAAPYDAVKTRLLDFPRYKELAGPKFKKVSVVDKTANGTDLYFQLPIMKGLVTIWYVTRFATARPGMGGADVIEGKFVKGNIKDMQIVFTLRPGPEQKTILVCDLNLALNIPAPQDLLDEELRDACGDALNAVRARMAQPPP